MSYENMEPPKPIMESIEPVPDPIHPVPAESVRLEIATKPKISIVVLGASLSLLFVITYALCVGFDLMLPEQAMRESWFRLLPGVTWLTWSSFFLGLFESAAYGWFVALVFAPLFNFFAARWR